MRNRMLAVIGLLVAQTSFASPTLSSCGNMELSHNGDRGLSYLLKCTAGDWQLNYTGSVPGGTEPVTVQYRLDVAGPSGKYSLYRDVALPAPAKLGSMLVREAVALEDGTLALKDCKEWGCAKYRPVGGDSQLSKATVTVPPSQELLVAERNKVQALLEACQAKLDKQTDQETTINGLRSLLADSLSKQKESNRPTDGGSSCATTPEDAAPVQAVRKEGASATIEKIKTLLADARLSATEERCNLMGGKNRRRDCRAVVRDGRVDALNKLKEIVSQH